MPLHPQEQAAWERLTATFELEIDAVEQASQDRRLPRIVAILQGADNSGPLLHRALLAADLACGMAWEYDLSVEELEALIGANEDRDIANG